jgi:F1F0 ATPase subunit 2
MSSQILVQIVGSLFCGMLLGAGYFALLYRSVRMFEVAAALPILLPLFLLRIGLAVCVFWGLVQFGAVSLIAGLIGFLCARAGTRYLISRHR